MKLLCDLNISPDTVAHLRALGHDAIRATERLPPNAGDEELVELARAEGRVLVTQDQDFGGLLAASGHSLPSVVNIRLELPRVERVNAALASALQTASDVLSAGAIVVVEEGRIRVRRLPIGAGTVDRT